MDANRWKQIKVVYDRALDLCGDERESLLAEACGDDDDLSSIPPTAVGGWFKSGLQEGRSSPESHQRQLVDGSGPTFDASATDRFKVGKLAPRIDAYGLRMKAGLEPSTNCRWWDSGKAAPDVGWT
jgi:hypothetical protein